MSMYDSAKNNREEIKELFPNGLNFRQIWLIVKLMKAARLYCRSNAAFNNYMNMVFEGIAQFRQVEREGTDGKKYPGLSVRMLKPDGSLKEEIIKGTEDKD